MPYSTPTIPVKFWIKDGQFKWMNWNQHHIVEALKNHEKYGLRFEDVSDLPFVEGTSAIVVYDNLYYAIKREDERFIEATGGLPEGLKEDLSNLYGEEDCLSDEGIQLVIMEKGWVRGNVEIDYDTGRPNGVISLCAGRDADLRDAIIPIVEHCIENKIPVESFLLTKGELDGTCHFDGLALDLENALLYAERKPAKSTSYRY